MKVDREIDLRGEVCPYTFVKSKLALEEMDIGEVLRVRIDYPMAAENVPRSMENEGQEVLEVKEVDKTEWELLLKKKK
ncbi:hypothetical protein AKJ66_00295 [candidate division MSBL1 archaeon SCGC-AAA259E22]|uniref:UPF0033 domain-containing protein n=2 Tax=candidate division MSBL1 TaxID=215777 RepID=A0A133U8W2_9EURY|nr:hypothetical protein AKJ61_00325 [candidate division MSBL1 archaeon SCGC-AAA259B11]KXA93950.1 hypothetical protein AKJ66_00295 [candidate division MSBL1 archaeon SCGC-AAA259E22]